jgi:hypothetical protein
MLNNIQKEYIVERYVDLVSHAESDYRRTVFLFIVLTNIITISGVMITALVSLDSINADDITGRNSIIFWIVWTMSIALTLANKWLYSFSIDKKYVLNHSTLEKLYNEGWTFLSGVGKYRKHDDLDVRFKVFCTRVEKIRMKSVESLSSIEFADSADILGEGKNLSMSSEDDGSSRDQLEQAKLAAMSAALQTHTADSARSESGVGAVLHKVKKGTFGLSPRDELYGSSADILRRDAANNRTRSGAKLSSTYDSSSTESPPVFYARKHPKSPLASSDIPMETTPQNTRSNQTGTSSTTGTTDATLNNKNTQQAGTPSPKNEKSSPHFDNISTDIPPLNLSQGPNNV